MSNPPHNRPMLIDSHCHLDYFQPEERADLLARAAAAGVGAMLTIGTKLEQSATVLAIADTYANVWATVGIHPHHAGEAPVPEVKDIVAWAAHRRCVGIGESGLDYFYDKSPREVQRESFRVHVRAAAAAGLPLVVHTRDADQDTIQILEQEFAVKPFKFLLHCFSSGRPLAVAALALGGYVSFSGILTFPKSHEVRAIARDMPLDRLLVETDAPYLAPVPHRGKRNEPAWVADTARVLAEVKGITPEALAEQTTDNFRRLFTRAE
jgi:TatD DNase family protein